MNQINVPEDVLSHLEGIFEDCNLAVSRKLSKMPNVYETSLDQTFIERLSDHAVPVKLGSGWTVRLATHFLGGGRHFGSWEIADIGFLVMFRHAGRLVRSKVALLQSKRLYPMEAHLDEDAPSNYRVGFGRLLETDEAYLSLSKPRKFRFKQLSEYKALLKGDDQYRHIEEFERYSEIPVYYMLYNPLRVPSSGTVPRTTKRNPRGPNKVGCRIVRSESIREALGSFDSGRVPCYGDLRVRLQAPYDSSPNEAGWRLEHFVARLLVTCEEGYVAGGRDDDALLPVFAHRSGPIAAAVGVTFDAPQNPEVS